ncbi:MAG: dTMP kinase [Solirubrobacteraceae bacterium]
MPRGRLITIEGLDGAGKTTLAMALLDVLRARLGDVHLLREPGGVEVAERIRDLVKDPGLRVGTRTEALLYAAARAELVEQAIEPLLHRGAWVVLDRFVDSSIAYQGAGRGLPIAAVRDLNEFATRGLRPDRTLLLRLDPALGRARAHARPAPLDRLELEREEFFQRIAAAYGRLALEEPERIRTIDAAQRPEEVLGCALQALAGLF